MGSGRPWRSVGLLLGLLTSRGRPLAFARAKLILSGVMGLFGDSSVSNLRRAQKLVEEVLTSFGVSLEKGRMSTNDGSTARAMMRGSAEVMIFLNPARSDDEDNYLRVVSPIVRMPHSEQPALYRRLLELNAKELFGVAFGVINDDVVLVAERGTRDLDRGEVEEILRHVGAAADHYDDIIVEQFGGRRFNETP